MQPTRFAFGVAKLPCFVLAGVIPGILGAETPTVPPNQTSWTLPAGSSGAWTTASNWDPRLPTEDDLAVIDSGGTAFIGRVASQITVDRLTVGYNNEGHLNQSSGVVEGLNSIGLMIGLETGANGSYTLSGGEVKSRKIVVGWDGDGQFMQSAGRLETDELGLGENISGTGSYLLEGGEVMVAGDVDVGNRGQGKFVQRGGELVTDRLNVGNIFPGNGEYLLEGGSLTSAISTVGFQGPGTFVQTGGVHTTGGAYVGHSVSGGQLFAASYTITGDAEFNVATALVVGNGPAGSFVQESGKVNVGASLSIGSGSWDEAGSYLLRDGELNTRDVTVGAGAAARFTQLGGKHTISQNLLVGPGTSGYYTEASKSGEYLMSGGELIVGGFAQIGGRSQFGKLAEFHLSGGSHAIKGDLVIAPEPNGPAFYNAVEGQLVVQGDVVIGRAISYEGGLRVVGNKSSIEVQGDLIMSFNQLGYSLELGVEIEPEGLSTIEVAGMAELRGHLYVDAAAGMEFTPGTTYQVLSALGGITGDLELVGPAADRFDLRVTPTALLLTARVPEPSAVMFVLLAVAGWLCRRRHLRIV